MIATLYIVCYQIQTAVEYYDVYVHANRQTVSHKLVKDSTDNITMRIW